MARIIFSNILRRGMTGALARQDIRLRFCLLLVIMFIIIVGNFIPSVRPFEGSLVVNQISFTNNSQTDKPLLQSIQSTKRLSIYGQLSLVLPGPFESNDKSISGASELKIKCPETGHWEIQPVNIKATSLELKQLILFQNSRVEGLNYYASDDTSDSIVKRTLAFFIKSDKFQITGQKSLARLSFQSIDPLRMVLERCEVTNLKSSERYEFTLKEPISEVSMDLLPDSQVEVELSSFNAQWFSGNFKVKSNVELSKLRNELSDPFPESNILAGKVRMAERQIDLEPNQFLVIDRSPGIENIYQIKPMSPNISESKTSEKSAKVSDTFGKLQVDVSGHTREIKVGLNPEIPISSIRSSLLEQFLPRDAVIALTSFLSAIVASLLVWLIENLFKSNSQP